MAVDPSRIAAAVVSGIGFLGAGAILRTGISVQGLTTAAGLWLVAAIGLCAGAAMYAESVLVTIVGLVTLTVLRHLEGKEDYVERRRISLIMVSPAPAAATIVCRSSSSSAPLSPRPTAIRSSTTDRSP